MTWKITALWCLGVTVSSGLMIFIISFAEWASPIELVDWVPLGRYFLGLYIIAFGCCALWKLFSAIKHRKAK
jgi:hypothetical protein